MIMKSLQETHDYAATVAADLDGGEVLALSGELGSGKTEFVRGLAIALNATDKVRSPSFTLLNLYRTDHPTIKHLVHVDLYRLENSTNTVAEEIGLDEWFGRDDVVIVIEWPSDMLLEGFEKVQRYKFEYGVGEDERIIEKK